MTAPASKDDKGMTQDRDLENLSMLGEGKTSPARALETFPNHHPGRGTFVTLITDEFNCICPATAQPDFATITIKYIPDQRIVELKSLKI